MLSGFGLVERSGAIVIFSALWLLVVPLAVAHDLLQAGARRLGVFQ